MLLSIVSTAAWALTKEGGFYQIGSAEDYAEFAALVNGGEKKANAILTADIGLGTDIDIYKIYDGEYEGVFDGAGHTITINFSDGTKDNQGPALFRSLGHYSVVKRLKVQGSITTERQHAAAIANYSGGIIRDCWVDVNITVTTTLSDASAAAIVGQCNKCSVIENCLAKVVIDAPGSHKFGGVAAWSDAQRTHFANNLVINEGNFDWSDEKSAGLVRNDGNLAIVDLETYNTDSYHNRPVGASVNNYVTNDFGFLNKGTTVVTAEEVASGKICYQLNSDQSQIRWKQVIGPDDYPVPAVFCGASGQVYASAATDCQGKATGDITYSNSGSVTATPHTYDRYGVCTTCGEFNWNCFDFNDPDRFDPLDRSFLINSGADLFLAEGWNRLQNGGLFNLKLTNDVECKPDPGQLIFNASDWIECSFNGQGHTLTIEMVNIPDRYPSFLPLPYAYRGDLVFENVIMHGKITSTYNSNSVLGGGAGGYTYGDNKHIYRNVYSDINISTERVGDNTVGGILGCANKGSHIFENVIYAGDINCVEGGTCVAGICGWSRGSADSFTNTAFVGNLNNAGGDSQTITRNGKTPVFTNIYSVNDYSAAGNNSDAGRFTRVTEEAVESGELAYLLNDKKSGFDRFYQLIGTDLCPMPIQKDGALVYAVAASYNCDGQPKGDITYTNSSETPVIPDHNFVDGICTNCGLMQEGYVKNPAEDGFYEIATPEQFLWWNNYAATHLDASARLTADIDMSAYNETYVGPDETEKTRTKYFTQVGTRNAPFYGSFDGQYHTISNLHIYLPGCEGAGLISVMNSQPSEGFGGLTANEARAAEGVFVKNVVLDKGSIYGKGYTGVVGMAAAWPGHITMTGVLNRGDVTVDGGTNSSGMFGCAMSSACHMTITGCGYIGNAHVFNDTCTENGLFSGWLGQFAEVTNCFALGSIDAYPDGARSWARHPNNSTCIIKNCYALEGSTNVHETGYDNNPEDVTFVTEEEVGNGVLTWKANGEQFRNPIWFQTVGEGEDESPTPIPTHGVIIYGAEEYFCAVSDEDIPAIAYTIQQYEDNLVEDDAVATLSLLDAWQTAVDALTDATTIASFTEAFYALEDTKAEVEENKATYQAYIEKCADILALLENDKSFEGTLRDALEYYLNEDAAAGEPTEDNPLGLYAYIVQNHVATAEEIEAEIARLDQWLKDAIAEDYKPGADVSKLIPNSDFSQQKEHWASAWCNSFGTVADSNNSGGMVVGVEAWNATGDMYQTVEGMKPGYYLVGVSGAFRPSNNRYSKNYAAGIYANSIFNYFPAVVEDYIAAADTIDQMNCNLHGLGSSDLDVAIYDDFITTTAAQAEENGATLLGYAVHGPYGMAAAANVGRYQVYTIAKVGEDGNLTIGFKNPGTKYDKDWTGWGPLKVLFCGDDETLAGDALDNVLVNMTARAQTIIAYTFDPESEDAYASRPYFPVALKDSLANAIADIESAETVEAKLELAETFSRIFQQVYEGKRAYVGLHDLVSELDKIETGNLPLVEKDETGEWCETGEMVFGDDFYDVLDALFDACNNGTFSTEQALDPAAALGEDMAANIVSIVPEQDEEGYYLISTPQQFVAYRALFLKDNPAIKAKLVNDVDMIGIGMQPFGNNTIGTGDSGINYTGILDGQGHALENVYIKFLGGRGCALFYELQDATVKNLKLTGEYYGDMQRMGGLTRYTSGSTRVENCEIAVIMHCDMEGDATSGGVMGCSRGGGNVFVENCLINCTFIGEKANSVGGVCGWRDGNLTVTNTLILSQYNLAKEPDNYPSDLFSRNGCTVNNSYYAERSEIDGAVIRGTKATNEQLASGEITYKLNTEQSENPVWFQTLGTDETPHLFGGATVYFYDGKYSNVAPVNGDVNHDGKVDIADAQFILINVADGGTNLECDVNGDGEVNVADVQTILIMIADQQ